MGLPDAAGWEFWIDVGGTFTDCVSRSPAGEVSLRKVLSSASMQGSLEQVGESTFQDLRRIGDRGNFWLGYAVTFLTAVGDRLPAGKVVAFDGSTGDFRISHPVPAEAVGYELISPEEAPIFAIRQTLQLRLEEPLPPLQVKLGTTRGTNALLTRSGARTALITNRGFADVLEIGNQDRPKLFELAVTRPAPLHERAVEIAGRIDAAGNEIEPLDPAEIRRVCGELKDADITAVAVVLLNSYANPEHEQTVAAIAREFGFESVTASAETVRRIKFVPRGDTAVLDTYLNPVLINYVSALRKSLGGEDADLLVMSSAGGLLPPDQFTGKESLLSGPAGGVAGLLQITKQAGYDRAIGFDMGGTSTDVSRIDGTPEMVYEGFKAGVRVATPMLAIETVAAGGGSICDFDGVKLTVGPKSAGAQPGPVCYGRGGPLTVTDVNLYLGRILPHRFPFPLDRAIVERRLESLIKRIAISPFGRVFTPTELAEGFRTIAIEAMARAIRSITVSKGVDPADSILVTFGGAGGQHACSLARNLGMREVLSHPMAGVLSAYGIGVADLRRFGELPLFLSLGKSDEQTADSVGGQIHQAVGELTEQLTKELRDSGVDQERILCHAALDLRYTGTDTPLTLPWNGSAAEIKRGFVAQHRRQYGYERPARAIEIAAVRVESVGQMLTPAATDEPVNEYSPEPIERATAVFDGEECEVGVYERGQLSPGARIAGPAIICEAAATFAVERGWVATITGRRDLIARDEQPLGSRSTEDSDVGTEADPIQLELFNNRFASIAEQMGEVLRRTAVSTNVKERLDYSCALFDAEGNLVVNAPHIPVHLGAMGETVRQVLVDHPHLARGDVILTNDPFRGGSHLPDLTTVTPIFDANGGLLFLTASRAHHAEIGGSVPGSMPPFSNSLAEEGVLIRSFKILSGGVSREEELRSLLMSGPYPSRSPDDNLADIAAQVAANARGAELLADLVDRCGLPVVRAYMKHIRNAAGEKVRQRLREFGTQERRFVDHLDDGSPIAVTVRLKDGEAVVDFTGTGPVLKSNLNANRAIVTAAVLYVFRCLLAEEIPLNGGVLDPVGLVLPECLLNPRADDDPALCPAIVGGNVETSQRLVDVLLGAFEAAAASQGTMNNLIFGSKTFGYYETICGGTGATAAANGCCGIHSHMTNTRLTDPEVLERRYPVRLRRFGFRPGSGGDGKHCGGQGVIREIEFLAPLSVAMLSERRGDFSPYGLNGGGSGQPGRNWLISPGSEPRNLGGKFQIDVSVGDRLRIETPGGGGWGASEQST